MGNEGYIGIKKEANKEALNGIRGNKIKDMKKPGYELADKKSLAKGKKKTNRWSPTHKE